MEEAWVTFTLMQATQWKFLPYPGGLLDQPDLLMHNIFILAALYAEHRVDHNA